MPNKIIFPHCHEPARAVLPAPMGKDNSAGFLFAGRPK